MRTYSDAVNDYLNFMANNTNDCYYLPVNFFKDKDKEKVIAVVFKKLLEKCYNKKDGMFYFTAFILGPLTDAGFPSPLVYNNLMRKWEKLIKLHKHLAILSARGAGKTIFFSLVLPLYRAFLFRNQKIMLVSASYPQSIANLSAIGDVINSNQILQAKQRKNDKVSEGTGLIEYNGGSIISRSVGSEIRGWHGDLIIHDDLLRSDEKIAANVIESFVLEDSDPMILARDGQIIFTGTGKNETDLFSKIEDLSQDETTGWKLFKFPAILDWENKVLQCPERFTWNQLMRKKASMTNLKFLKEYQLEFYSSKYGLFPINIITPAIEKGRDHVFERKTEKNYSYVIGIDCARSGSISADYTVVVVMKYNPTTFDKKIVFAWRAKGMKTSQQVNKIAEIAEMFDRPVILVEKNNIGVDFIDMLIDDYGLMVESYTTGNNKEELIRYLINAFENEKIIIPYGDVESREMMDIFLSELSKFKPVISKAGNEQFRGVGSKDDCLRAGANVLTKNGYKKIENIKIGDEVLTHLGRFKRVWKTIKKHYNGKAYIIKPFCSNEITVTKEHPIYTSKRNSHSYKMHNYKWVLPNEMNKSTAHGMGYRRRLLYKTYNDIIDIDKIDLLEYIIKKRNNKFCNFLKYDEEFIWYSNNSKIKRFITIDNDFLRFIGIFLAEGNSNECNNATTFVFNTKEKNLINFVENYFINMNIKTRKYVNGNSTVVCCSNKILYNFLKSMGKKEFKKPFDFLMYLPPKKQIKVLDGWFEGDGWKSNNISYCATNSYDLATFMYNVLLRNNINVNLRKRNVYRYGKKNKDQYYISYNKNSHNNTKTKLENGYKHSAIHHIKEIEIDEDVYNLEVEEDESYVVEQTIVHNCVIALCLTNMATKSIATAPFAIVDGFVKEKRNESELEYSMRMGLMR